MLVNGDKKSEKPDPSPIPDVRKHVCCARHQKTVDVGHGELFFYRILLLTFFLIRDNKWIENLDKSRRLGRLTMASLMSCKARCIIGSSGKSDYPVAYLKLHDSPHRVL